MCGGDQLRHALGVAHRLTIVILLPTLSAAYFRRDRADTKNFVLVPSLQMPNKWKPESTNFMKTTRLVAK